MSDDLVDLQKMTAHQAARVAKKLVKSNKMKGPAADRAKYGLPPAVSGPSLKRRLTTINP